MVYQSLMAENSPDYFDEEKLRENAITSIKHGIQDFYRASLFYQRVKELPRMTLHTLLFMIITKRLVNRIVVEASLPYVIFRQEYFCY